jgi:hypothetical protein
MQKVFVSANITDAPTNNLTAPVGINNLKVAFGCGHFRCCRIENNPKQEDDGSTEGYSDHHPK